MHSILRSPSGPAPLTEFHCFERLPVEIKLEIWEHHFRGMLRPNVHRITFTHRLGNLGLPFGLVVESSQNVQISTVDRNITEDSQKAALWVEQAHCTGEPILRDVGNNLRKIYDKLTEGFPWVADILLSDQLTDGPDTTQICWANDLLYIEMPNFPHPLDVLCGSFENPPDGPAPQWLARVQRLAIYFNKTGLESFLPPWRPDRFNDVFESLRELIIVVDQHPHRNASINSLTRFLRLESALRTRRRPSGSLQRIARTFRRVFRDPRPWLGALPAYLYFRRMWGGPLYRRYGRALHIDIAVMDPTV
ncbi:hypothetical protein F4775DRAFT_590237 [Biscogniauxia sp. FL1348]|nr:hypothetical protein F4775DRAFT_590237 [Biscogniauxia sp. FL1348]